MSDKELRKLFWAGTWNGLNFDAAATESVIQNTIKAGLDLPIWVRHTRMDGNDADAEGWVRKDTVKADGPVMLGQPSDLSEMLSNAKTKRPYLSPEMSWANAKTRKDVESNPGGARIYGFAAVASPAMYPQERLTEDGDYCEMMACDDWATSEKDTESTVPVTHLHIHGDNNVFHFDTDSGELAAQQEGEAMKENEAASTEAEVEEELKEEPTVEAAEETTTETETETETLSENTEVLELRATVTKGKIATAAADLNKATKLSIDEVETFTTNMANLDDVDKDDEGLTTLDKQLAFEARTRHPAVVLAETATADKGGEAKPEVKLATSHELMLNKSLAYLADQGISINETDTDLTARFEAICKENPTMPPWDAFNQASREIYGKESD